MEPVTDRVAFRLEFTIMDQVSAISFSGFFDPTSTIEAKDKLVDDLIAVAERQRAKNDILSLEVIRADKQRVVDQEKVRLGQILAAAETQKANGGIQDATNSAMTAAQQNISRREDEVAVVDLKIEALKPKLREQPAAGS